MKDDTGAQECIDVMEFQITLMLMAKLQLTTQLSITKNSLYLGQETGSNVE